MAGLEESDLSSVIEEADKERASRVLRANCEEIARIVGSLNARTKDPAKEKMTHELLNQCLTALSIAPLPYEIFAVLGGAGILSSSEEIAAVVEKFRKFAIYHFGGFRRAFASLTTGRVSLQTFAELWTELYRYEDPGAIRRLTDALAARARLSGIEPVDGDALWALGYLAPEHAKTVNEARSALLPHLEQALKLGVDDPPALERVIVEGVIAQGRSRPTVDSMINRAHLPDDACLFNVPEGIFGPYRGRLERAIKYCQIVSPQRIDQLKERGRQNTFVYLTTGEVDVYVATSMRDPEHFTTTAAFTKRLFEHKDVAHLNLRYFDPTQSFCHDRFDKGLLEILMIHRSKVTVYHAQEQDTFGKDSEASLSLAAAKPVIVYVTRLFARLSAFSKMYVAIDQCQKPTEKALMLDSLREQTLLARDRIEELAPPEFTKAHIIDSIVDQYAKKALEGVQPAEIHGELYIHGYRFSAPPGWEDLGIGERKDHLMQYTTTRIKALERRALTFREGHPLSLQASPFDGVARGVFVTRSVDQTAEVLSRVLLGTVRYTLRELGYTWALYDEITDSPIRIVTKDKSMTHAFWTDFRDPLPLSFGGQRNTP